MTPDISHIPWAEGYPDEEEIEDFVFTISEFLSRLEQYELGDELNDEVLKLLRQTEAWIEQHSLH